MQDAAGFLDEAHGRLRSRARAAIEDMRAELATFGAAKEDLDALRQAARDLEELFLMVIVGEFNSGKSALINALLGAGVLEEGVTPTTASINILRHGQDSAERWLSGNVLERQHPAPLLKDVAIVDTPGTNAVLRQHQELTEQFVPRSDLVLFVTSSDRPFTESERAFMEAIRSWGKKVVLVLNKTDLLRGEEDLAQVVAFVTEQVRTLLGFRPEVFPVSARRAREAPALADGLSADPEFARLQRFLHETLNQENRVKLKLSSPLGVAARVAHKYQAVANGRLELLGEDARTGESMEAQLNHYREDTRAQFTPRLHEVENIVYDLSDRADRFFDETFRLARVFDLVNSDKVRGDFERQVLANTSERIESSVDSISNWLVDREIRLWEGIADELSRRRQARPEALLLGDIGGDFETSRRGLIQNVSRSSRRAVAGFDREAEAKSLGDTMREAVAQTALVEVGALGLGTLVAVAVGTAAADVTGILAGTVLAGLGLYIIPARKHRAQRQFQEKVSELRVGLRDTLSRQLNAELDGSVERIQAAITPYVRFVRSEQEKVSQFHDRLSELQAEMGGLRREIGNPTFEG